jgi:hypothetical protein
MQRFSSNQIILFCLIGFSLLLAGCKGGPGFLRSTRIRPIPDSWFPLTEEHYAIGETDAIRLKVAGTRLWNTLGFDLFIDNAGKSNVLLCKECVVFDSLGYSGSKAPVSLSPNYAGEPYIDHGLYVIPAGSVRLFQWISRFDNPKPQKIRIEVTVIRVNGRSSKFTFNFEVPKK